MNGHQQTNSRTLNAQQASSSTTPYRTPPPPPINSHHLQQQHQQTPHLPLNDQSPLTQNSSSSSSSSSTPPPPQAPVRTNIRTTLNKHAPLPPPPAPPSRTINNVNISNSNSHDQSNNQYENATNAAARLVMKSVMMGSVQSLNNNNLNQQQQQLNENDNKLNKISAGANVQDANLNHNLRNLSIIGDTNNKKQVVTDVAAGVLINSTTKNQSNDEPNGNNIKQNNSDSPSFTYSSSVTTKTSTNQGSHTNSSTNNKTSSFSNPKNKSNLPWNPINGEEIFLDDPVDSKIIFVMPDNRGIHGKLYISNFRLFFRSDDSHNPNQNIIIDLPLGIINRIEKIGHQSSKHANFYGILINCKNGRRLRFANTETKGSRKQIYELLQRYAFPISETNDPTSLFAFKFKQAFPDNNGWSVYDAKQEYERMGVTRSNDWRFTEINSKYKFCETYPRVLVVPQSIRDEDLEKVAEFRSKHRIPVVSWLKCDNSKVYAALLRSSQPLTGFTQKRNEKDEYYLYQLKQMNTLNSLDKLFIMDARPMVNALANRGTGGGYENEDNYKECEIGFLNIHNIHVMRESLRKVFDMAMPNSSSYSNQSSSNQSSSNLVAGNQTSTLSHNRSISYGGGAGGIILNGANSSSSNNSANSSTQNNLSDDKNFYLNLENSKWLEHIRLILNGVLRIVKYIHYHNSSVLVHCSDGWDRTSQLTSLSMLMMDKYYRTLKGFEVLVEKEWLSFGHRFGIRMGHGTDKHSDQDRSPIFLQFIDCVWQIMQQNSKVFEFNEKFLLAIVNNMYTCQFGTFLFNNECEREEYELKSKTVSLWSYINSFKNEFKNNSYIEYDGVVECSTSLCSLQLWTNYYFQYKEIIDDSMNEYTLSNFNSRSSSNQNFTYTMTPPMPSSKMFGQAFFQQVVSQMKASVRNSTPQEPELIRYKACISQSDMI